MGLTLLLDQGSAVNFNGTNPFHRRINLSWMVISSISLHILFFWCVFLYAPRLVQDKLPLQDYHVSLISPKFLDMGRKEPSGPVSAPVPEVQPASPVPPPVMKNAEVDMEIPKKAVPIKAPPPLPPAKFFPDPVMPKLDTAIKTPPPMEVQSASKLNEEKPVSPELVAPANTLSPEKNGITATASIGSSGSGVGTAPTGSGFGYPYYLSNIEHKIATNWAPPRTTLATKKQERAMAVIGFVIKQDGRIDIKSILVEKSSGNAFFDMAALRAIHNANPMPPLPKGISDDLKVHFSFAVSLDS